MFNSLLTILIVTFKIAILINISIYKINMYIHCVFLEFSN